MKGKVFLLTGLSGAGKTTLAEAVQARLKSENSLIILDGDILRRGLNADLGFSAQAREENLRRAGEMAKLLAEQGFHVLMALIAPYETARSALTQIIGSENLRIVHVACPLEVCISRDPKQNYRKALAGQLQGNTGIADIYEVPSKPHLILQTHETDLNTCTQMLAAFVQKEIAAKK